MKEAFDKKREEGVAENLNVRTEMGGDEVDERLFALPPGAKVSHSNRSVYLIAGVPNLVLRKRVDRSALSTDIGIPLDLLKRIEEDSQREHLRCSDSQVLILMCEGEKFPVKVRIARKADGSIRDFRIEYRQNGNLSWLFRERFQRSYHYIEHIWTHRPEDEKYQSVPVPDDSAEYIDFYKTDEPHTYRIELVARDYVEQVTDDEVERSVDEPNMLGMLSNRTRQELAEFTHSDPREIMEIEELLNTKKQIMLEGPPGSGKTFIADAFARCLTGNRLKGPTNDQVVIVQFHQSYGYEDFIHGIRPHTGSDGRLSYELRDGIFKELCDRAGKRPDEPFVIVVDEINRGNIARIFGELLLLLEYRDKQIRLPYASAADALFSIPDNVYLIGTMNTADRSLAQVDYALRRRFYFYRFSPIVNGHAPYLEHWLEVQQVKPEDKDFVSRLYIVLNDLVSGELGDDYLVGHSYFMNKDIFTPSGRERIWRRAILPLLAEYFHNHRSRSELLASFSLDRLMAACTPAEAAE